MIMMITMMMMMPTMFGSRVTHPVTEGAKSGGEGEDKTRRGASLKINQITFSASCRTGRITWIAQCHCLLVSQSVPRCPNVFPGREVQSLRFVDGRSCQNPRDHLSLTGLSHHRATSTFPLFQSIITSAGRPGSHQTNHVIAAVADSAFAATMFCSSSCLTLYFTG